MQQNKLSFWITIITCILMVLCSAPSAFAQEVEAWKDGDAVYYRIYDSQSGNWKEGHTQTPNGYIVNGLTVNGEIVVWKMDPSDATIMHTSIHYAAYDPQQGVWKDDYTQAPVDYVVNNLTVNGRIIAWKIDHKDATSRNETVHWVVYDPLQGEWQEASSPLTGFEWEGYAISQLLVEDGIVAWAKRNIGVNVNPSEYVLYATYDQNKGGWQIDYWSPETYSLEEYYAQDLNLENNIVAWQMRKGGDSVDFCRAYSKQLGVWTACSTISGTVQDTNGAPIANLHLYAVNIDTDEWTAGTNTNLDGSYSLRVPTGSYEVSTCTGCSGLSYVNETYDDVYGSDDATPVSVPEGTEQSGIDFVLEEGGTISGTVKDTNGDPIVNLHLYAINIDTQQWTAGTNTNPDGSYSLRVPTGSYEVSTCTGCSGLSYVNETYDDVYSSGDASPVSVSEPNDTPGIDFVLEQGGTISGTVQDENGNPIVNLHLFASDYDTNQWVAGANTEQDGSYSIMLPSGDYRVSTCTDRTGLPYIDEFYNDTFDYGMAVSVSVSAPNDTSGIDFVLAQGGTISGTVYQEDGVTPITGVQMRVDVLQGDPCGIRQRIAQADIDPDTGMYSISVPAGTHYVRTSSMGWSNYVNEWWTSSTSLAECNAAQTLTVAAGETTADINFQLEFETPIPGGNDLVDGVFFTQYKTITIDGNYDDWEDADRAYVDANGPDCNNIAGRDIKAVYVAQDDEFIYLRYVLNGPVDETFGYKFRGGHGDQKHTYIGQDITGEAYMFYAIPPSDENPEWSSEDLPGDFVSISGNQFEYKIPKADVQMWSGQPLIAWLDQGRPDGVCNDHVQLPTINLFSSDDVIALAPAGVRPCRKYTLWLEYTNEGDSVMPAPLFVVSNDSGAQMGLSKDGPFSAEPIQVPGSGPLAPGETARIPMFFEVPCDLPSHHFIHFSVEEVIDSGTVLVAIAESEVIRPEDPNAKAAPAGIGDQHYVVAGTELGYTVFFENVETAAAPAQEVFVTDILNENLDWTTFELGEVAFGDQIVNDLAGSQEGIVRVSLSANMDVDIIVAFDDANGVISMTLRTIDPLTGQLPEDALTGFLPPNDATGRGEGHVTFTVQTKNDLAPGTVIPNAATIVFDTEAPIATNEVFNTIGTHFPGIPTDPGISDGAIDVAVSAVFSWAASEYAMSYDLYLWELSEPLRPELPLVADLQLPAYDPFDELEYGTTYMWQVIAKNVMGEVAGLMWSFTTEIEPIEPVIPEPATLLLIGTGLFGILALMRRKRQQKK